MNVWVHTVKHGRFTFSVTSETQISSLKNQVVQHLATQKILVPPEQVLAFKGKITKDSTTLQSLGVVDSDTLFFLYNLEAKVVSPEPVQPQTPTVVPTKATGPSLDVLNQLEGKKDNLDAFPFPNTEIIETIQGMGFSKFLAQKALIYTKFEPEAAVEWIFTNMESPHLYDPVPFELLRIAFIYLHPEAEQNMDKMILDCVANNKCTIIATKKTFQKQSWFKCYTCGFVDSQGICAGCAKVCHAGHSLSPDQSTHMDGGFYCDCGMEPSCRCNK